jgi:hypothetical protein
MLNASFYWGKQIVMNRIHIFSIILTIILLVAAISLLVSSSQPFNQPKEQVYVGVAYGGITVEHAKLLIDKVKSYTNLFVLASGLNPVSNNQSAVEEICDYATNAGLNIIVNLGTRTRDNWKWKIEFYDSAQEKYGNKFLGAYYDDEPGGIPLDWDWKTYFAQDGPLFSGANPLDLTPVHLRVEVTELTGKAPENYTIESQWFNQLIVRNQGFSSLKERNITTVTSDYVLYWFNYLAGYDKLFAQLGHNETSTSEITYQSVNQQTTLALLRGAATMQKKEWGTIITWKYNVPPYLDTGLNVYDQMKTSYHAGAKYIMLFNYPYNVTDANGDLNPYGVLKTEHFLALKTFWDKVLHQQTPNSAKAEAALVLPKDYGWGLRSPTDRIWGFWGPDDKSPLIWNNTQILLNRYGLSLDIIYDDPNFPIQGNYSKIYYWNQPIT